MKVKYLLALVCLVLSNLSFSQSNFPFDTLVKLSSRNLYEDTDTSIYYAKLAIEKSYEDENEKGRISAYRILGNAYFMNNQYWVAEDAYNQAISLAKEINDERQLAYGWSNLANVYNTTKEYTKALEMYMKAYKILIKAKDSVSTGKVLNNIGLIHQYQKNYSKALEFYYAAISIKGMIGDSTGMAPTLANLGLVLYRYDKPKEAIENMLMAIELFEEAREYKRVFTTEVMLAGIYIDMDEYGKAEKLLEAFRKDESIIVSLEFKHAAHESLSKIYKKKGDYKNALIQFEKFTTLQDSVRQFEKIENQDLNKSKLINEKNKIEIAELKSEQHENEAYQSNLELHVAKSEYNNIVMISSLVVLGIISISIFFILFLRNKNLKRELTYNELKSGIVHVISHEFRNPLAGIMSSSELLRPDIQDEQDLKFLDRIDKSSEHMLEILTSFTEPIEFKEEKFSMRKIPIQETTKEIVSNVITENEIDYNFITEQDDLYLSKTIYTVILRNLLTNALKYGKENGRIIVSITQTNKSQIKIEVKDFGNGISRKAQKTIFEKGDRGIQTDNRGDGMGLFIVKSYLDLIGGSIKVSSKLNQGSTFTVIMPVQKIV